MTDSPALSPNDRASLERDQPCPSCDTAHSAGAKFCPDCGKSLQPASVVEAATGTVSDGLTGEAIRAVDKDHSAAPSDKQPLLPLVRSAPAKTEPTTCSCGAVLFEDAPYCHQCGQKVGQTRVALTRLGKQSPLSADIGPDELTIGSAVACGVAITDDEFVSRRHARVTRSDGLLFLEDLGSSNGTFLRVRRPIVLESGDEIVVGASVFRLRQDGR